MRGVEGLALAVAAVPPIHFSRPHVRHATLISSRRKDILSSRPILLGSSFAVARFERWRGLCGLRNVLPDPFAYESKPGNYTSGVIFNECQQGGLWTDARRRARFDEGGEYRVYQELLEGKKTRFVSRVMYDGTSYHGFQLQSSGRPTIQVRRFRSHITTIFWVAPYYCLACSRVTLDA